MTVRDTLVGALLCASIAGPARADRATADQLAAEGDATASAGDIATAAAKFRAAFDADPRPELACNIGVAYYKLSDLPRAERYLRQCLDTGLDIDVHFLDRVRTVLSTVEGRGSQHGRHADRAAGQRLHPARHGLLLRRAHRADHRDRPRGPDAAVPVLRARQRWRPRRVRVLAP